MRAVSVINENNVSLYAHLSALQEERDQNLIRINFWREKFETERDRRYAEVNNEREKAVAIKDTADLRALDLKNELDKYKDEKANNLREQIGSERGLYATKEDVRFLSDKTEAITKPLIDFVARSHGGSDKWGQIVIGVGLIGTIITIIFKF